MIEDRLVIRPLTLETWQDFETVMGPNGASRGCWCMHWRLTIADWMRQRGEGNRQAMRQLATEDPPPGLIGYVDKKPVAWCSLGPRAAYPRLDRSPILASIDDAPVCAITCLFIHRQHRRQGLSLALLKAACAFAAESGYEVVEGYPVEPKAGKRAGSDTVMTGIASVFVKAGFVEVARHKADRPIVRKHV